MCFKRVERHRFSRKLVEFHDWSGLGKSLGRRGFLTSAGGYSIPDKPNHDIPLPPVPMASPSRRTARRKVALHLVMGFFEQVDDGSCIFRKRSLEYVYGHVMSRRERSSQGPMGLHFSI